MEQEFLTGKCPKCMQELRVPASLAEFSCMYCGARLAQSDLVTEAAETPAAPDADAYAAALEELSGCIRNYRGFHKRVTKTDYVPAFDEYEAGCRAVVVRLDAGLAGLAACNSQTASPFGCLNNFYFKILSNFLGSLQDGPVVLLLLFWDLITQRFFRLFSCKIRRISSFVPNTSSWKLLAETRTAPWPRMMSCSRLSLVATRTLRRPRSS